MTENARKIVEALREKGWGLYARVLEERRLERTLAGGVVEDLQEGVMYDLYPLAISQKSQAEARAFLRNKVEEAPGIYAPELMFPGRIVAQFGEEDSADDRDERFIQPKEPLELQGIELLSEEVRLIRSIGTFMPYGMFIQALETLRDIRSLSIA